LSEAPDSHIHSVGGTAGGADAAIVMKSTFSSTAFSKDPKKGLEVCWIIANPRHRKWYGEIGTMEGFPYLVPMAS